MLHACVDHVHGGGNGLALCWAGGRYRENEATRRPPGNLHLLGAHGLAVNAGELALAVGLDPVEQGLVDHAQRPGRRRNALAALDQALKQWQAQRPELFNKRVYELAGLDIYRIRRLRRATKSMWGLRSTGILACQWRVSSRRNGTSRFTPSVSLARATPSTTMCTA